MSTVTSRNRPATVVVFKDPGTGVVIETVSVALRQAPSQRAALVVPAPGLTEAKAILEARLVEPLELPESVKAGAQAELVWAGRNGVARLEPYQDALTPRLRQKFGERILLSWRTDEVP